MPKRFGLGDGSAYVDKNFSWSVCDVSARWTPARTPGPAGESAQHPVPPEEELAVLRLVRALELQLREAVLVARSSLDQPAEPAVHYFAHEPLWLAQI